jgi:hypothetical protein
MRTILLIAVLCLGNVFDTATVATQQVASPAIRAAHALEPGLQLVDRQLDGSADVLVRGSTWLHRAHPTVGVICIGAWTGAYVC